tara:strand:- start:303 stop:512 length:210 start_codon:yes stop_codon:yes gene_type:complete
MTEGYIICGLVLLINSAALWFVLCKRFDEVIDKVNAESVYISEQIVRVDSMLDTVNENVLKLSDNVVEM